MLSEGKQTVTPDPVLDYEKQLEYLYARRSAIDALIESLEAYDRYRAARQEPARARLKTA
jgi:hypothetical protein